MKTFRLTKITGLLLLLWFAYACSNDYDDYSAEEQQTPFTIGMAKTMYQQYVGNRARMKSAGENGDIAELTPGWDYATLASDTNWTVVESPLEFDGNRIIRMTTESVGEQYADNKNPYAGMQEMSLVVMQHKKTQTTYAFTMFILPELDYLQANNNSIADRNSYLSRDVNLSGLVMFYNVEGQFVNGWKYRDGEIIGYVAAGEDDEPKLRPKSWGYYEWECVEYSNFEYEPITGEWLWGYGVKCERVYVQKNDHFYNSIDDLFDGPGGISLGDGNGIGGGGGGSTSDDVPDWMDKLKLIIDKLPVAELKENAIIMIDLDGDGVMDGYIYKDKEGKLYYTDFSGGEVIIEGNGFRTNPIPVLPGSIAFPPLPFGDNIGETGLRKDVGKTTDDDCDESTKKAVKEMMDRLGKVKTVEEAIALLRNYAQTLSKNEIGVVIDKNNTIHFYQGKGGSVPFPSGNSGTHLEVHVHPYYGYSAPSVTDVHRLLTQIYYKAGTAGAMIIAHNGSEYLLYIEDRIRAGSIDLNLWKGNDSGGFADQEMQKIQKDYIKYLEKQGYNEYQAYEYARAQMIKEFAPGLKLYKRNGGNEDFKQMNPSKDANNTLTPKNCD